MNYEASFALAAILITALLVYYFLRLNKVSSFQSSLFLILIVDNGITAASSFGKWLLERSESRPLWALDLMSYIYFITHLAMIVILFLYIFSQARSWREMPVWVRLVVIVPGAAEVALILLNPLLHLIYYYTPDGVYHRASGIATTYATFSFYYLLTVFVLLWYRRSFSVRKRTAVLSIMAVGLISVLIQLFLPEIQIEVLAIAVCALGLFYFVQNPLEKIDPVLGVYSRAAFLEQMKYNIISRKRFDIVEIVLADYREYERSTRLGQGERVLTQVKEFLSSIAETANLYHIDDDAFVLEVAQPKPKEVGDMMRAVTKRFEEGTWHGMEGELSLSVRMLRLKMPDEINEEEMLTGVMSRFEASRHETRAMTAADFDMTSIERNRKITAALARAMEKKQFEMRYMPIHSMALGRVIGAEATLRFYDEELGYVYDEEIFNYAERSGHTLQLGEMIIERTCRYIAERRLKEQGISFVGVRLLPTMCLQYGLLEKVLGIIEHYRIDPKLLYLQLSEYTVSQANAIFRENIRRLEDAGVRLCLEDYGSGFTNITSIYELPFKVMKINKGVLHAALGNEKARVTMECTLELARELSMMTMIEGIDTQEYFDMISDMACDFAKGNYLFEQLDEDEFLKVVHISAGKAEAGEVL